MKGQGQIHIHSIKKGGTQSRTSRFEWLTKYDSAKGFGLIVNGQLYVLGRSTKTRRRRRHQVGV